jgi:hypothetical protein
VVVIGEFRRRQGLSGVLRNMQTERNTATTYLMVIEVVRIGGVEVVLEVLGRVVESVID